MLLKKDKLFQLLLWQEDINKSEFEKQIRSNVDVQFIKDMDKFGNLKLFISFLIKKWFRKQFGICKGMV